MKKNEILKYVLYFMVFAFYFFIEDRLGIRPFAIAFFMALIYCRQNCLILIPLYIGAAMLASPSINMLILSAAPCVVIAVAYFIHYKLQKKIKLIAVSAYMFLSQIPLIFLETSDLYNIINTVISLLGAQIYIYCSVITLYAVLVKKLKFKLSLDEVLAFSALAAALGMGLMLIDIYGYTPFYTVLAVVALSLLFIDGKSALAACAAYGIGGSIAAGSPDVLALSVLYGLITVCFSKESQYFAGIAIVASDAIFRAFFQSGDTFSYISLISPIAGVLIFFILPNKLKRKLERFSPCFGERPSTRTLVNRDRKLVADKLEALSGVFYEIQDILHMENRERKEKRDTEMLTREVSARCCNNCLSAPGCREALGADTDIVINGLVLAALDNGKATILDTPPFLSSRCKKINGLITATNDITERYRKNEERQANLDEGRAMISEQMGGVGRVLSDLKKEVEKSLSYDKSAEDKLLSELHANNIAATDAAIFAIDKSAPSLTLTLHESDCGKTALTDTVNYVLGNRMEIVKTEKTVKGMVTLHFEKAPVYKVVYGEREISKRSGEVSGDRHGAVKISHNKVMLILSDGMGSGRSASLNSSYAMSLIESFYRAGFDYKTILTSVGKLLSLRDSEDFNAVDIAVIDTQSGTVEFIKLGGRESFIVNRGAVEVIDCGSLPLGIIDEALPIVEKRRLTSGSFIVMVSDGVIDAIGKEGLIELLSEAKTNNPDTLAEMVITDLLRISNGKDDASVVVARIFSEAP